MGAELSREVDEEPHNHQHQQLLRPQSQSQPQPQPQLSRTQSPQLRRPQSQLQPQPQPQPVANNEGATSKDGWLLPSKPSIKATNSSVENYSPTRVVKPNKGNNHHQLATTKSSKELMMNLPHRYEDILKGADSPVHTSSKEKLLDQLYSGVFLDHNTKKYWIEEKSNSNCFMLYARALSITWAENQHYWKWVTQKESSGTIIEYEVSFIVMLKDPAQGWEVPVNVRLVLPGGKKQQHKESLIEKLRMQWIEIPVGEFVASEKDGGEMEVSLYEYEGGMWKQGLVIKGVAIKPKELS
ncbi:protein PHLOEM PROTEIN 2-LIKE A1 [Arachis ipaensis]|uniref:protein PHLOEM PROTEIN 2-LIKE A1 n=1 Tax=Arachis ipaensis TaxID=130454 RepID=UPI000A2B4D6D|nr:protein PHLOEM PROTEIN 2-LIKE A1 [Arachis ipaensis]